METNNTQAEERLRNVRQYAVQCIKDECDATLKLIDQLDDNFDRAVSMMYHCKGKIIVTGVGKSGNIGAKIAATLSSTGTPAFFINPLDVYHGDLGVMTKDDVVLALSNSGQTDELLRFIPMVLHMNVPIIGMSGNPVPVGEVCYGPPAGEGREGGLPAQPGADQFHDRCPRHGRRACYRIDGGPRLQAQGLCTVPSGW